MSKILICSYTEELLPIQWTPDAACWDIYCSEEVEIKSWTIITVKTGIKTALPQGRGAKIYARSSLPSKRGLMLANNIAIIDSDYRGEYLLQVYNFSDKTVHLKEKTRVAQIEFFPHLHLKNEIYSFGTDEVPQLETRVSRELFNHFAQEFPTQRGEGGIGSTGS